MNRNILALALRARASTMSTPLNGICVTDDTWRREDSADVDSVATDSFAVGAPCFPA
jgi:hypothetical protein